MPSVSLSHEAARTSGRADWGAFVRRFIIYVPLAGFVVNLAIGLAGEVHDWKLTALKAGLTWLVGVNGLITGAGHMLTPAPVAASIGWPTSRFQWEVGLADFSYGVAGLLAPSFDRGFWFATIIVFSIFMVGAAVGHVRSMVAERNFAPGNAGYIFWYDLGVPVLLIALYFFSR